MNISVILPCLNDSEILNTLQSLRDTSGEKCEILVIDDCSKIPVQVPSKWENVKVIRNKQRIGVDKCRHLGAELSRGDVVLLLDAHMRATDGWYENLVARMESSPNTIINGCTLGLSEGKMDTKRFDGKSCPGTGFYCGARLSIYDPSDPSVDHRILEGKWKQHEDGAEISSLMGAIYACPRDLFFRVGGLSSLCMWGSSEQFLSLKAWLAGYEIRQCNTVRIGHKFRALNAAPYATELYNLPLNKMRVIQTVFPPDLIDFLMDKFPNTNSVNLAKKKIKEQAAEIAKEREYLQSIFVRDMSWFYKKFPDVKNPLTP